MDTIAYLEGRIRRLEQALLIVANQRLLGRSTSGTGAVEALEPDVVRSMIGAGTGSGSVTSVGLSLPGVFTVSGSPVTTSGTLTVALATQSANVVWAGPTGGGAAAPTFRALVESDIPSLSAAKVPTAINTGATGQSKEGNLGSWRYLYCDAWAHDVATYGTGAVGLFYKASTRQLFIQANDGFGMGGSSLGFAILPVPASGSAVVWTSENDGTGSGLDADLLDGNSGGYFVDRANHTGTQSFGTITGTVPVNQGGTGLTSYSTGDLIYATGSGTLSKLALPGDSYAGGNYTCFLTRPPSSTAPSWMPLIHPPSGTDVLAVHASSGFVTTSMLELVSVASDAIVASSLLQLPGTGAAAQARSVKFDSSTNTLSIHNGTAWKSVTLT